jgi:hypothetical protein
MSLPIVFIHKSNSDYLIYSLLQAKQTNPQSDIILLGDYSNDCYKFIHHENLNNYLFGARELGKVYKHFHNINSYLNELLCFQRWFVLRDFMQTNNFNRCLYIDSDVMLYANVTQEQDKFSEFDLTLSHNLSPHCNFINNLNALEKYCYFVFSLYTDSSIVKEIDQLMQEVSQKRVWGGVSDMTVFRAFKELPECNIGEVSTIIEDSIYDHNINASDDFEMRNGIKSIFFVEGQPFGRHIPSGKSLKFNALHFQGKAKKLMKDYFTGELNLDEKTISLPVKLGETNLIIFPDWAASEEEIYQNLEQAIRAIATHPARSYITLLVDTSGISADDANLFLSDVAMNLFMQEDLDITEELEISFVGQLNEIQWKALLPRLKTRIVLEKENQQAIAAVKAENLPSCKPESLSQKPAF